MMVHVIDTANERGLGRVEVLEASMVSELEARTACAKRSGLTRLGFDCPSQPDRSDSLTK